MKKHTKRSNVALSVTILRLLGLGLALFVFIWQNIFYILVPPNASASGLSNFFSLMGLLYGLLLCGTFFPMSNSTFRRAYQFVFALISVGIVAFLGLNILWSLVFAATIRVLIALQTINILMLVIVITNTKIVLQNIDAFVRPRKILYGALLVYLIGLTVLTVRWRYLAESIPCRGRSMTTAGNIEDWNYVLPRFHCWKYKLWSVE